MKVLTATRLGAIGILMSTSAMAGGHLDGMTPDDLLPLALEEGTVTVYSFTSRIGRVETAFEEAYPGIDLQGFDISSTEQIARLKAEAQAGVTNADVVYISDAPVVLTELLSDPRMPRNVGVLLSQLPLLDSDPAFWERAGRLRAKLLARRHRARLADTLIAQSCIDHDVRLVTRDDDFRHFARVGRLRLAL